MSLLRNGKVRKMLVVTLTFCIITATQSLPVYPPGYAPPIDPYQVSAYPGVDPYQVSAYPAVDPYSVSPVYMPSVDVYYQVPQPVAYPAVDPYSIPQPYPSVDPYAQPAAYPAYMDPYSQVVLYPAIDPYPSISAYPLPQPYPSIDPYASPYPVPPPQPYPSVDPYAQSIYSIPSPQPYPSVDPYAQPYPSIDPYAQPYPSIDPYAQPSAYPPPQPYPSVYPEPPPAYPSLDPYSLSIPQSYQVAPTYQQPPPVVVEEDTYLAVSYHNKDRRKHCGILPATNDDIYSSDPMPGGVNDVLPYGAFPWLALIVDLDENSVACVGTLIHSEYVLTVASCITKPAGKYTVVKDWDILTIYNEYEAYKSYADPVCTYWPLGVDNSTGQSQYRLGGPEAELILLIGPLEEHHDLYPVDKILCLPSASSALPAPYGYQPPNPYGAPTYPTPYPQISYDYSNSYIPTGECWVAGYYNSPTAILQNHPPATAASGQQQPPPYGQQYYSTLDNSKVPRRALVKQIQCPADHPSPGYDDVCFVGVNGYDACVADKGTAILCVIDDNTQYESGFVDDPTTDHGELPPGISSANPQPYQQPPSYQQQTIQLQPAQQKLNRRRGILYAVVKSTTTCMPPSPPGYPPNQQQQSNYIVGARVSPSIKSAIQDLFWETGYDLSCPTERIGDVLPNSQEYPSMSPPLPYSLAPSVQPQQYDPSLSILSSYQVPSSLYPQPVLSPYPQDIYSG